MKCEKWSKWKAVGKIAVDTATIMVADPCQVIPSDSDIQKDFNGDWHKFLDVVFESQWPRLPELPDKMTKAAINQYLNTLKKLRQRKPQSAFPVCKQSALCINTGSDGIYIVEARTKGRKKEIRIQCY